MFQKIKDFLFKYHRKADGGKKHVLAVGIEFWRAAH